MICKDVATKYSEAKNISEYLLTEAGIMEKCKRNLKIIRQRLELEIYRMKV
jgi:hypothetical protein